MSSEEQSNKGPAPITPPTYNISDMFRAEVGPMVKKMVDQLSQQMKDSASAEEEARQKLRSELFQEQRKLQKRVGAMLEEDTRKKPNGGLDEPEMMQTKSLGKRKTSPLSSVRQPGEWSLMRRIRNSGWKLVGCPRSSLRTIGRK